MRHGGGQQIIGGKGWRRRPQRCCRKPCKIAFPDPEVVTETKRKLAEAGVEYVLSCWVDLLGEPKTKPVPLGARGSVQRQGTAGNLPCTRSRWFRSLGPPIPIRSLSPISSLGSVPGTKIAWVFSDLFYQGGPYDVCPVLRSSGRSSLRRTRISSVAGYEPEFIVMRLERRAGP